MNKETRRFLCELVVLLFILLGAFGTALFHADIGNIYADYKLRQEMEGDWRYVAARIIESSSSFAYVVDIEKLPIDDDIFMVSVWIYLDDTLSSQEREERANKLAAINLAALEATSIPGAVGTAIMYCKIQERESFSGPTKYAVGYFGITGPTKGMRAWAEAGGSLDALNKLHVEGTIAVWTPAPFAPPQEHYTKLARPSTEVPPWDD